MMGRVALIAMLCAAVLSAGLADHGETTTVILVRHAEKVDASADPELSDEGRARAEALSDVLADAGVSVIYTTQFRRTNLTADPLAKRLKVEPIVVQAGSSYAADIAMRIRKEQTGKTTLVVGHSNTIGPVLKQLGIDADVILADNEYSDIFICTIPDGGKPSLIRLHY